MNKHVSVAHVKPQSIPSTPRGAVVVPVVAKQTQPQPASEKKG